MILRKTATICPVRVSLTQQDLGHYTKVKHLEQ